MSHTNSTANYQLPQFIGTDKPAWLTDVNQAYADIDTALKANEVSAGQANALATQNASAISTMSGQISTLSTKVTALETAQPTDEAQIETNRQNIATNAQNIVEIDNRLGHTPIASIGDGTVTGAINDLQEQISEIPTPTTPDADDVSYDNTASGLTATNVQDAINELNSDIGDLSGLDTTDKSSLVNAINEVIQGGSTVSVTADGVKTAQQLLNALWALINFSKVSAKAVIQFGVYNSQLYRVENGILYFSGGQSAPDTNSSSVVQVAQNNSHYGTWNNNTYSNNDTFVPSAGYVITLYY